MFMPQEHRSFHPEQNAYGASNNSTSDFNILVTRVKVYLWLFKNTVSKHMETVRHQSIKYSSSKLKRVKSQHCHFRELTSGFTA
jgi:hypothetical protein